MDQGPDPKKPRLLTGSAASAWSNGPTTTTHHRGSQSNLNSAAVSPRAPPPQPQPPHHHPTHPGPPYQAAHSFSRPSHPPPVSSPASPTPGSALSYTHTHSLPPPPPPQHHQHQQQQQIRPPPPYPQDRRQYEPESPYAHPPPTHDQRQDYRPDYRQDHHPPDYPDHRQQGYYRQDYRQPPPSPAHHRSPSNAAPYPSRENHLSEDGVPRPNSAASLHPPPTPTQHQIDDSRRQMSFDHLANPSLSPRTQPPPLPPPPPPPAAHQQHPQHQQPPLQSPSQQHPGQHQQYPPPHQPAQQPPQHQHHQQPSHPNVLAQPGTHSHAHPIATQPQAQPPPPPPPAAVVSAPGAVVNMYGPPTYPPTPTTTMGPAHHYEPPVYSQQPPPVSQSAEVVYPVAYATAGKKKAQRASQACDSCRSLKAKCDETKPCKNCREKNIECKYRDPVPKQQDKMAADILEGITSMRSEMSDMLQTEIGNLTRNHLRQFHEEFNLLGRRMSTLDRRMFTLESAVQHGLPNANLQALEPQENRTLSEDEEELAFDPQYPKDGSLTLDDVDMAKEGPINRGAEGGEEASRIALPPAEAEKITRQMQDDYRINIQEPGPPVPPGEPAIPAYHRTLAGLLLTWPTIKERVGHLLEAEGIKYPWEYPIRQEEQRGNIRFYGRGEGFDRQPASSRERQLSIRDGESPQDGDPIDAINLNDRMRTSRSNSHSSDNFDRMSDTSSTLAGEIWGQTGGLAVPGSVDYKGPSTNTHAIGELDLTPEKVWKYVQSYKDNIQNIHPIIIPQELHAMVTVFLKSFPRGSYSPTTRPWASAPVAHFVGTPESPTVEGSLKRKRSPVAEGPGATSTGASPLPLKTGQPFRNIESALVLVVLALGKICLCKDRLPDVVPEDETEAANLQSPQANGVSPSSVQDSPSSSYQTGDRHPASRRPSLQSQVASQSQTNISRSNSQSYPKPLKGHHMKRNVDYIPGLDYFAVACDIIGNHVGGRELKLVWVLILGSLYYGQLARPIQSLEFVAMAGRHLQTLLRPHFYRYGILRNELRKLQSKRDNQYTFAFWTCLQLESDILAELQLPPSGILAYEHHMPYPNSELSVTQGVDERVLQSYAAQLYLRNRLNEIHKNLYGGLEDGQAPNIKQVHVIADSLQSHRWAPENFAFSDNDTPATDILAARLRAKYWGAQNVTHRFYVKRILEYNYWRKQQEATEPQESKRKKMRLDEEKFNGVEAFSTLSIQFAQRGIKALIESTRAFHCLTEKRFVITNVFGTAHAQWGNLLVLDSIERDPILGRFVSTELVNDLFRKTIEFFEVVQQPTNALGYDMRILKGLYNIRLREAPAVPEPVPLGTELDLALRLALHAFHLGLTSSTAVASAGTSPPPPPPDKIYMPLYGMVEAGKETNRAEMMELEQSARALGLVVDDKGMAISISNGIILVSKQGATGDDENDENSPMVAASMAQTSPMQTSTTQTPPMHNNPGYSMPPAQGTMAAPPMHSPAQMHIGQLTFAPPSVKGPSTPSDSDFPHYLPTYNKRTSLEGSD